MSLRDPKPVARVAIALGMLVLIAVGTRLVRPPKLSSTSSGSAELGARFVDAMHSDLGLDAVAVVEFFPDRVVEWYAGTEINGEGVSGTTRFEIGSIQKTLTGMKAFSMVESGDIDATTTLQELVGAPDRGSSTLTVERLVTHRSGLPRGQQSITDFAGIALAAATGVGWPEGETSDEVLDEALAYGTADNPSFSYSNLGFAALGQGLARHEGTTYKDLMRAWIAESTGVDLHIVAVPAELPAQRTREHSPLLFAPARALFSIGYQPAGVGIWASALDLSTIGQAVMNDAFPGSGATDVVASKGPGYGIGYSWHRDAINKGDFDPGQIIWHNGGTGGASSFLGYNEPEQRGVVILSNSASRDVTNAGLLMLGADPDSLPEPAIWTRAILILPLVGSMVIAGWRAKPRSALGFAATSLSALVGLLLVRGLIASGGVSPAVWYLSFAVFIGVAIRSAFTAAQTGELVDGRWKRELLTVVMLLCFVALYLAH